VRIPYLQIKWYANEQILQSSNSQPIFAFTKMSSLYTPQGSLTHFKCNILGKKWKLNATLACKRIPIKPKVYSKTVPLTTRCFKHSASKTDNINSLFDEFSKKRSNYSRFLNECQLSSNNMNAKINQILSRNTIEAQLTATESPWQKYGEEILITSIDPSDKKKIKCSTQRALSFICNDANECLIDKGIKKDNGVTQLFKRTITLIDQKESEAISTARNSLKITIPSSNNNKQKRDMSIVLMKIKVMHFFH
jgi:hypothetical protein